MLNFFLIFSYNQLSNGVCICKLARVTFLALFVKITVEKMFSSAQRLSFKIIIRTIQAFILLFVEFIFLFHSLLLLVQAVKKTGFSASTTHFGCTMLVFRGKIGQYLQIHFG